MTQNGIFTKREVALVINLRSRSAPSFSRRAVDELARQGVRVNGSHLVRDGPALVDVVRAAIERGAGTVVIGGGDGTLSAVVDLFANRPDLTLGLLPMGTGNEVARVLGIPLDLAGACSVVAGGKTAAVDLAQADGNYFIHTALVGHPAHVNHALPGWLKRRFGKAAYAYSLLVSILRSKPFHARITDGHAFWEGRTVLVVLGNGLFHAPGSVLLPWAEEARRGLLIYTPRESGTISLLRLAIALWITHRKQPSLLHAIWAEAASVAAAPAQEVDLDGEFAYVTPVHFRHVPEALRVLVPESFSGGRLA